MCLFSLNANGIAGFIKNRVLNNKNDLIYFYYLYLNFNSIEIN
jgi:hypothetical protein